VGFSFLVLFARLDFAAIIFRAMGFATEKMWDCPIAATSLGNFWGRRWNRIVPGFLREVIFLPVARRAGAKVALLTVFLYSGLYHELFSFMANSGYGGPFLYFMVQCLGVAIENTRWMRRLLRGRVWLARAWTFAVVFLPVHLFVNRGMVDGYLVPLLLRAGVPGLKR
jgi:alginate O-acetyltransferase complex protein AlgI